MIGGIYTGVFTPTEAAAVGAVGTGLIALVQPRADLAGVPHGDGQMATGTGMIFMIILGAAPLNNFLALSQLPQVAAAFVTEQGFNPWLVMTLILIMYLILGGPMDSLSMILLTIPVVYPVAGARFRAQPRGVLDLVRHPHADRRGGGPHQSACRDESVRHQFDGARRADQRHLPRGGAVSHFRHRAHAARAFPPISLALLRWLYG